MEKRRQKGIREFNPNHFFTATHKISRSEFPISLLSIHVISKDTRKTRFPAVSQELNSTNIKFNIKNKIMQLY